MGQTIEFEKLDANSGYWWNREFVSKLFDGNVAKNVTSFLRSAGTLSYWKWKAIWYFWWRDCRIQSIPSAQRPPQQPAPNCWYREEEGNEKRKEVFHIRKLHRQELRLRRSTELSAYLCNPSWWKMLRVMLRTPCHEIADQPHADDFAAMLARLFHGDHAPPMIRLTLTEPPWTMAEVRHAISRLKVGRIND